MAFTKVTGTLVDIGDLDLTNVGQIQLDSIAGDADSNTSITFSGSDVITIATGGSNRLTIGDGALSPVTDNQIDLGTSSLEFKDAYFDGTVTSDAFAGPLTGDVTGTADVATSVTASANNSTDETVYLTFVDGATGTQGIETDTGLTYNPSSGLLTTTLLAGTLNTAAQPNITSVGTLTGFTSTGIDDNADATAITIGSDESVDFAKGIAVQGSGSTAGVYLNGTDSDSITQGNYVRYSTNFVTQSNAANSQLITYAFNGSTFVKGQIVKSDGTVELYYGNNKVLNTASGAVQISSHGTGGNLNLFSDSGTNEGQFNLTYLTDGSSDAHSVAEIRMQQGSGDGSARKGEILFRVSDNGGPATAMTIHSNKNVLLSGLTSGIANASLDDLTVGNGSGNTGMTIYSGTSNYGGIAFADGNTGASDQYPGLLEYFHTDNALQFYTGATLRMRIMSDGEIVQGTASLADTYSPLVNGLTADGLIVGRHANSGSLGLWRTNTMEWKYYHNGMGYIMTFGSNGVLSGDFNDTSDVNLKENISSISDGTTVIKALRPVKFDWKDAKKGNNQHGFIAQEVEKVLPDAVEGNDYVENETGLPEDEPAGNGKNMNSNAVLAHAVKAIQELEARIKVLEG